LTLFKDEQDRVVGIINVSEWRESHTFQVKEKDREEKKKEKE